MIKQASAGTRRRSGPVSRAHGRGFNPENLLRLAERLAKNSDEASLRSAVSRAYYSVFLIARNFLGLDNRSDSVHRETQEKMASLGYKNIAFSLYRLRQFRNAADYRTSHQVDVSRAEESVATARTCCRALLRIHLPHKPPKTSAALQQNTAALSPAQRTRGGHNHRHADGG